MFIFALCFAVAFGHSPLFKANYFPIVKGSTTPYDFRYASAGRLCVNDRNRFYTATAKTHNLYARLPKSSVLFNTNAYTIVAQMLRGAVQKGQRSLCSAIVAEHKEILQHTH